MSTEPDSEGVYAAAFDFIECFGEGATVSAAVQDLRSKAEATLEAVLAEFAAIRLPTEDGKCDAGVVLDFLHWHMPVDTEVHVAHFTVFPTARDTGGH